MKTLCVLLTLTLALGLTACNKNEVVDTLTSTTDSVAQTGSEAIEDANEMIDEGAEMAEDAMEKTGELITEAETTLTTLSATYTAYDEAEATGQPHVLFFYAPWCPTCVKWEAMLEARMAELTPEARLYKTDYDTSDELKAQYGITKQSTAVFINADGSVAKTEADPSVESLNAFFGS